MKNTEQETLPNSASIHRSDSSDTERSGSNAANDKIVSPTIAKRRGTGPRTNAGKKRSRQNSFKHGLYSKDVLLPGEPREEYRSLLNRIRRDLQPVGTVEINIVDEYVVNEWHKRRMLLAEGAEIQKSRVFLVSDQERAYRVEEAEIIRSGAVCSEGLITKIENPDILERCLDLLKQLKSGIKDDGLDFVDAEEILNALYSESEKNPLFINLRDIYLHILTSIQCADQSVQPENNASLEKNRLNIFLRHLSREIKRLHHCKKHRESMESVRMELVALSRSIPDEKQLNRFSGYQSARSRESDRLLSRLERRQRMRLGQSLPPQIDVSVSSDEI
jgi:hypothetical protein